jgi:hypothetical protein
MQIKSCIKQEASDLETIKLPEIICEAALLQQNSKESQLQCSILESPHTVKHQNHADNVKKSSTALMTLEKNSVVRITNWFLKISSELHKLKKVEEGFQNCDQILALRGKYTSPTSEVGLCPYLQMTVKFGKPMTETGGKKIITQFIKLNETKKFTFIPLNSPKEIKEKLEEVKTSKMLNDTEEVSKGDDYTFIASLKKDTTQLAQKMILEMGKNRAEEEWAECGFSGEKFNKALKQVSWMEEVKKKKERRLKAEEQASKFYHWQQYLAKELEKSADDRTIWCVLDEKGCNGKSYFQRVIGDLYENDVLMMPNGSTRDMYFLASNNVGYKIVMMNIVRQSDTVNLSALEGIKDGLIQSTKYRAKNARMDPPHVILLSNIPLEWGGLTEDRWKILYIKPEHDLAMKDSYEVLSLSEYLSCFSGKKFTDTNIL